MRRVMMTALGGVLLVASCTAVAVLHGCGTSSGKNSMSEAKQPQPVRAMDSDWKPVAGDSAVGFDPSASTPIGVPQNSVGVANAEPFLDARWLQFRDVPQIDLKGAIAQQQGTVNTGADFNRDGSVSAEDIAEFLRKHPEAAAMLPDADAATDDFTHGFYMSRVKVDFGGSPAPSSPQPVAEPTQLTAEQKFNLALQSLDGMDSLKSKPDAANATPQVVPAQFVLHPGQELWVIERPVDRQARRDDDTPGSGTMMTSWAEPGQEARMVPVPLQHTDVNASIAGPIASVQVTQQFANPYSSKIEAVYVFPLPDDAAVNDFVMTIGSRSIRGVIREREQAEQIYQQAKSQGYRASLMTQERSNIFTQKVANIEPSEKIDVSITYFNTLGYRDGSYEFVFPMVVGPRFNPPSTLRGVARGDGTGIGAVPVNANGASGQATEVSYLRPSERSGTDISVNVDLDAGVAVESISSPSHQVNITPDAGNPARAKIALSGYDSIPNRDFVLRYRVAGGQPKAGMITFDDGRQGKGGFFSMVIVPPEDLKYTRRGPVELVLVIDCSGSMDGEALTLAKKSAVNMLRQLRPEDSFQVIRFSDTASFMTRQAIGAEARNVEDGVRYVENLQSGGGTVMLNGLEPALAAKGEDWGWAKTRYVCVLSDGQLGNEPEVLGQLAKKLGDSRVFTLGFGASPNRTLMNAMSRLGRGAAGYVGNERDAVEVTDLFVQRISCAAMTDLRFDWGGMDVVDVYPKRIPDLYIGRPVVITGRYRGWDKGSGEVRISGRVGTEREEMRVSVQSGNTNPNAKGLPLVWARTRITELDEQTSWGAKPGAGSEQGPNRGEIKDLALRFGLLSAYTSFIAVDSMGRTGGSYGTSVAVPVNMPAGTKYETTVGER